MVTVAAATFNRHPSRVKRAAADGPVVITDHDRPSFVLLTYAEYERLTKTPTDLAAWLEMPEDIDFEIEPVGLDIEAADL